MVINRRELVAGLAGITLLGAPASPRAQAQRVLTVSRRTLEVKGKAATVYGLTGPDGKPGLDMLLGERFNVRLRNDTDTDTVVHWHGLTPPYGQDGVAMLGQDPIPPGQSYDYDFANTRSGTHWMHSHMGLQEQQLLAAPLIVRETKEPAVRQRRSMWCCCMTSPSAIPPRSWPNSPAGGGAHAGHAMGMDHGKHGSFGAWTRPHGRMMGGMLNDVVYDAYLANDRTLDDPGGRDGREGRHDPAAHHQRGGGQQHVDRPRRARGRADRGRWQCHPSAEGQRCSRSPSPSAPTSASPSRQAGGAFPVLFRPEGVAARTGIVLATPGAASRKIAGEGDVAPALDLSQERSTAPWPSRARSRSPAPRCSC